MKSEKSMFWAAVVSGAVGAGFGSASGSNSTLIVILVGAAISFLVFWGISGMLK